MVSWRGVEHRKDSVMQFLAGLKVASRDVVRPTSSICQARRPLGPKPFQPLAYRALRYFELEGNRFRRMSSICYAAND